VLSTVAVAINRSFSASLRLGGEKVFLGVSSVSLWWIGCCEFWLRILASLAPDRLGKIKEMSDAEQIPLPPASFTFLVLSLRTQAEMQLGLMHFGEEEEAPQPELLLARHTIDMLGVLLEKTRGNLTLDEQRLLENSLTELRFRFVQVSEESARAAQQQG
jgi:hypothetical protein